MIPRHGRRDGNDTALRQYVRAHGVEVIPLNISGGPDWLCAGQRFALVEVKRPGEKLRPNQSVWWQAWRGPEPWLVRDEADCDALIRWLKGAQ